jgi:hypothetical protein
MAVIPAGPGDRRRLSDRGAWAVLAGVGALLVGVALGTDLARLSKGEFWGDGATYYLMAHSLAEDFDLRYEARDLLRARREFKAGPQGLFLKRAHGGLAFDRDAGFPWMRRVTIEEPRLYFAKAFAYPVVAAPFVRVFGTRGLVVTNALALALVVGLAYGTLRRREAAPGPALAASLSLTLATVAPLYLLWPTPEVFVLAVVAGGLAAGSRGRPMLAAVLFGIAAYSKPPNVLLAIPLVVAPLLPGPEAWPATSEVWRGVRESLRRGLVLVATAVALYGLNAAVTGEMNYQGGERKTFYARFPLEAHQVTFDNTGFWMTTNQVGPLVEGRDDAAATARTGPARAAAELRWSFLYNVVYFWIGRFGGVLGYFMPAAWAVALFLLAGPRDREGWLALLAFVASWLAYLWIIPDNWYGGGGTVGNRYFLSFLPLVFFLVPRGRAWLVAVAGVVGLAVFVGPILRSPIRHSLRPGDHALAPAFRALPAELTMLNDLGVFSDLWRKKQPYGFVGEPNGPPADPDAYFLYFTDDGTFGREVYDGRTGFWLRAGEPAEVILRAFDRAPVHQVRVRLTGGIGGEVTARLGGSSERLRLAPGEVREAVLPAPRGFPYYDTYLYVLSFRSEGQAGERPDGRSAFVELILDVGPLAVP